VRLWFTADSRFQPCFLSCKCLGEAVCVAGNDGASAALRTGVDERARGAPAASAYRSGRASLVPEFLSTLNAGNRKVFLWIGQGIGLDPGELLVKNNRFVNKVFFPSFLSLVVQSFSNDRGFPIRIFARLLVLTTPPRILGFQHPSSSAAVCCYTRLFVFSFSPAFLCTPRTRGIVSIIDFRR